MQSVLGLGGEGGGGGGEGVRQMYNKVLQSAQT